MPDIIVTLGKDQRLLHAEGYGNWDMRKPRPEIAPFLFELFMHLDQRRLYPHHIPLELQGRHAAPLHAHINALK